MILCVNLFWPSKIIYYLFLMQNVFYVWVFEDKLIQKCVFWRFGLNLSVFEKILISYSCISFMKQCALRSFCIKMLCFSKIYFFQTFDWSNLFFDQSKLRLKFLVWVCLTRLMFDRFSIDRNCKIFSFYVFDQNFFSCIIYV